ncbi:DNA-directed RNA polymerase subunit omega [bacterium]|nr:DNA-directed RNA polymerase subunit omega [bacterium]
MTQISFDAFLEKNENVYEAVVAMSKRARQITDRQKREIEREMEMNPLSESRDVTDDFDEIEIDREALKRKRTKFPKPTTLAMVEMIEQGISYDFRRDEETGASDES